MLLRVHASTWFASKIRVLSSTNAILVPFTNLSKAVVTNNPIFYFFPCPWPKQLLAAPAGT